MKFRLTYFCTLLIATMSLASANEAVGSALCKADKTYDTSTKAYSNQRLNSIARLVSGQTSTKGSDKDDTGAQIRQSPDATMNGTIIPVSNVILSLIAVLHLQKTEGFPKIFNLSRQEVLFKILFQVIISPNAP